jgi:hypothetical protein
LTYIKNSGADLKVLYQRCSRALSRTIRAFPIVQSN